MLVFLRGAEVTINMKYVLCGCSADLGNVQCGGMTWGMCCVITKRTDYRIVLTTLPSGHVSSRVLIT